MSVKDEIRYHLPKWGKNTGPHFRTAGYLAGVIHGIVNPTTRRQVTHHAEQLVERGDLQRRIKGGLVFYAHAQPRKNERS